MPLASRTSPRRGASRARLILPVAGLGLIAACSMLLLRNRFAPSQSVSHVRRAIQQVALAGGEPDAPRGAGVIGPWRVAAEAVDPVSGTLLGVRIESGPMIVTAATATLQIDPEHDTFSFELNDVVYLRVPDEKTGEAAGVHRIDRHVLGPAPYGMDIVPDRATAPPLPAEATPLTQGQ